MKPQFLPRATAGVCALLLAGGAGLAVSKAGSDSALPSGGAAQQAGIGMRGAGGPGGMDLSALAEELGVSEAELESAMASARPDGQPGAGGPDEMAAALAKALGLSETKVAAALEAVRPSPPAGGGTPPSDPAAATTTT